MILDKKTAPGDWRVGCGEFQSRRGDLEWARGDLMSALMERA
ncbi:MAG: hypothetical protein OXC53_06555 [Rhodobacteraceae bacterium]|nr:hypothetical protein [Paracoccaceae bacterium]